SYNIGTLAQGAHQVTAVAWDSQGASATLPGHNGAGTITVTSANTPPFGYMDYAHKNSDTTTTIPQNGTLVVGGWAADQEDGSPVAQVTIYIDGNGIGNARLGESRPDLGARYSQGGWSFAYNVGTMAPGTHHVTAVAFDSQGASTTLPSYNGAGTITIGP